MTSRPSARREAEVDGRWREQPEAGEHPDIETVMRRLLDDDGRDGRAAPPPAGIQPVDRILSSLERIGDRIRALSAVDMAQGREGTEARAERPGIELQRAIEQIATKRDALERAAREERRPAAEARTPAEPPGWDALRAELAGLRARVEASDPAPRIGALEANYDEVVRRLDQLRNAIDNPRTVADLVQRLAEIRRLIAETPRQNQLIEIADRLDRLDGRLDATGQVAEDIAELTQQVTALAVAVAGLDPVDSLAVIDARLSEVDGHVAALEERLDALPLIAENLERQAAIVGLLAQRANDIPRLAHDLERQAAAVERIAGSVDLVPQMVTDLADLRGALDADASQVRALFDHIAVRLDQLAAELADEASTERLASLVEDRVGEVLRRLDDYQGTPDPAFLDYLGDRFAHLEAAFDTRIAEIRALAAEPRLPDDVGQALARIETRLDDDGRFETVREALAGLAERLDRPVLPEELAEALNRIQAGLRDPAIGNRFDALDAGLAELRARPAEIALPAALADSLARIETRLADDGRFETVREELAGLAERLDRPVLPEELAEALDRIQAGLRDPAIGNRFDALDAGLAELRARPAEVALPAALLESLARIEAQLAAVPDDRLAGIETRVADLADAVGALDLLAPHDLEALEGEMAGLKAAVAGLAPTSVSGLEEDVRALADAVSKLAAPVAPAQLDRLERRIASLAERLDLLPAEGTKVNDALARFDATLSRALGDGGVIDAAARAAALAAIAEHGAIAGQSLTAELRAEIAALHRTVAGDAERDRALLAGMAETLERLAASLPGVPAGARIPTPDTHPAPDRSRDTAAAWSEIERALTESLTRMQDTGTPAVSEQAPAERKDDDGDRELDGFLAIADQEDRPLEPGSGRPPTRSGAALAAIDAPRSELSKADFIAAARRAAQAAEAGGRSRDVTAEPRTDNAGPRGGRGRGALLAGAAVVVIAAALARFGGPLVDWAEQVSAVWTGGAEAPVATTLAPDSVEEAAPRADPAAIDPTTTATTPIGPTGSFDRRPVVPPADRFEPRTPDVGETAAVAGPQPPALAQAALPDGIGPLPLREAARAGDPRAQYEVASRYAEGRGVPQDLAAAAAWYSQAAAAGLAPAEFRLGTLFEKGQGLPRDPAKAVAWYTRAAEAGHARAMHNLAVLASDGSAGAPDYETAAHWFGEAAELGVRDSQFNLAILYAKGLGVPRDLTLSYKWFAVAAEAGDAEAARKRDDVAAVLDADALARARLTVETFEPKTPDPSANGVEITDPSWLAVPEQTAAVAGDVPLVAKAQVLLAARGYDPGPPDGRMGERTRLAVEAFQRQRGLPVTGLVDEALLKALAEQGA